MGIRAWLVLMVLLSRGTAAAMGGGDDPRSDGLAGVFLVCKEYGTVRGTFLTSVRGRDIARLNFLFGEEVGPRLSRIDDRILFTSTRGGAPGVWMMDRTGRQQKRLCDGEEGDWFPDGRRIIFRRQGRVLERSLDNGRETVLSPSGWQACSWPACCPDGQKILFVARHGKDAMYVIRPGEAEPKRLVEGEILGAPRWSPGGQRIAYQCGPHLWMIDADGGNKRQLTTIGGIQRRPAWSPDGSAIAYCQGPGPKGLWQMAVISIDGARKVSIPLGDARSVLCSDWGLEEPGRQAEPKETAASPPPGVRLWEIDELVTEAPEDWAAFCRERKGWIAITERSALRQGPRGGCAVESQNAMLLLLTGRTDAVLLSRPSAPSPIEFSLLDSQGKETGPMESVRVLACGPDEVTLESSSHATGAPVKAAWRIGGSRPLVQVTPLENAGKIHATVPMQRVVATDRFGNDLVADSELLGEDRSLLPWTPLVVGLMGSSSDMLVLICPEQGQTVELRKGSGPSLAGADVAFQNHGLSLGVVSGEHTWHLERFGTDGAADPLRFQWRMPYAANWRLTVQGGRERYSALFSDKESALFDKEHVLCPQGNDFAAPVRLGLIYLYSRTAGTPPEALTPVDLMRDALGLEAARQVLDEEGLTGYREAAGPTTWASLSATMESLDYLFERQLEVQDGVYARHLCDDLPSFVKGMDERLKEYADFSRAIQTLCERADKANATIAAGLLEDLAAVSQRLRELDQRQQGLRSLEELPPVCARIKELTSAESSGNRRRYEQSLAALLRVVGPREELVRAYRKLAVEARDSSGQRLQDGPAPVVQAELLGVAEKTRSLCQRVLRNRFYTEADWRGEDYNAPGFWLGPRPYE